MRRKDIMTALAVGFCLFALGILGIPARAQMQAVPPALVDADPVPVAL